MAETARERRDRLARERAEAMVQGVQAPGGALAEALRAKLAQRDVAARRKELSRRLHALGVPTADAEIPHTEAELAELEAFATQYEKTGK